VELIKIKTLEDELRLDPEFAAIILDWKLSGGVPEVRGGCKVGIRQTPSFICDEELFSSMHDDNESGGTACTSEPGRVGRDR
jgi:hypothetical protein